MSQIEVKSVLNKRGHSRQKTDHMDKGTIIQEENEYATIPYQSNNSIIRKDEVEQEKTEEEHEDITLLMREESILIKIAKPKQLQ